MHAPGPRNGVGRRHRMAANLRHYSVVFLDRTSREFFWFIWLFPTYEVNVYSIKIIHIKKGEKSCSKKYNKSGENTKAVKVHKTISL